MKKIKFIYNPHSGDKTIKNYIDECTEVFQEFGYEVHLFRLSSNLDIEDMLKETPVGYYDFFVISGGDGSVNIFVNSFIKYGHEQTPIGIIPSGTANDFASYLKIPTNKPAACRFLCEAKPHFVDIGLVKSGDNERYFINVCAGGLFSGVSRTVYKEFKDVFGKLAYYATGVEEMKNFVPIKMRITNSKENAIEENICLFLALNTSGTGGINNISPEASINDGLFDFVAIKDTPIPEILPLVHKFLSGNYLSDKNIIFFRDSKIKIENLSNDSKYLLTDTDGEEGPEMPIEIINQHSKLKILF